MRRRTTRRTTGFTLIELLVVVAVIGIIAAILIPSLLDSLQKAKQKRTLSEMRLVGLAWMSWLTDQVGAGAAGASQLDWSAMTAKSHDQLEADLVPRYLQEIPEVDAWKHRYQYGIDDDLQGPRPVGIRALGSDGLADAEEYEVGSFVATDYVQDIVWVGGYFVRWPQGLSTN